MGHPKRCQSLIILQLFQVEFDFHQMRLERFHRRLHQILLLLLRSLERDIQKRSGSLPLSEISRDTLGCAAHDHAILRPLFES